MDPMNLESRRCFMATLLTSLRGRWAVSDERRASIAAVSGALCLGSSAILVRLADSSASVTSLARCALALPILGALSMLERKRGLPVPSRRSQWMARFAGAFLAGDLILWAHSISAIGAGLATVIPNLQVPIVALAAWGLLGERPPRALFFVVPMMLTGIAFVVGFANAAAGTGRTAAGVAFGAATAVCYAIFILLLRQATGLGVHGVPTSIARPLYEASLGGAVTSLLLMIALHDFAIGPLWPSVGWLALLAVSSQAIGWLLITAAMPRLPVASVSTLLLVQPVSALALSIAFLGERPAAAQIAGAGLILLGVFVAARFPARRDEPTESAE
jgi:drug/metabolite transporter (DMT)-like permease